MDRDSVSTQKSLLIIEGFIPKIVVEILVDALVLKTDFAIA